jgi:alginate O-acetyltransferase complex protein AlgI
MLFNSWAFLLGFLPITLLGFWIAQKYFSLRSVSLWLLFISVFFYGYWDYHNLFILIPSILVNYGIYCCMKNAYEHKKNLKRFMILGMCFNILLLLYYKYRYFIAHDIFHMDISSKIIEIPLGISFFTFTQIAFLVDSYKNFFKKNDLVNYSLFVTYFPHLIAGPIINFKSVYPQLTNSSKFSLSWNSTSLAIVLFSIGLFKKCVLADNLVDAVPIAFDPRATFYFLECFTGVLSYTLQLYFDFSGYSDMAVGLSYLFGLQIPFNFNSPYKATSIIDFWRRWHITLSNFLREYLYIPLGGNRCSPFRHYLNLFLTMTIGGIWHGASWNFLLWGVYHGILLIINHLWKNLLTFWNFKSPAPYLTKFLGLVLTFILVCGGWVLFRANDLDHAINIYKGLLGLNGYKDAIRDLVNINQILWIVAGLFIVWGLPNTIRIQELFMQWIEGENVRKIKLMAFGCAFILAFALLNFNKITTFLYFQF